jgi:hypothetical protein
VTGVWASRGILASARSSRVFMAPSLRREIGVRNSSTPPLPEDYCARSAVGGQRESVPDAVHSKEALAGKILGADPRSFERRISQLLTINGEA